MVKAAEEAGVATMVWYNYRRVPAVTLAKEIVDSGKLGRIFHYRTVFLQDWTISRDLPQGGDGLWRLDVNVAGSGVTGDLLAHNIDTAMWLNGPIDEVVAMTETFIKTRKHNLTGKEEPVGIDDASAFLARFRNGSLATFEATRYARGHKALYTLEINGEHASIAWDLHDLHRLQYFDHRDEGPLRGWRSIHITDGDHPYMNHWWVPGLQIGYEHTFIHQAADFIGALGEGKRAAPDFGDALKTDYVTDAVLESAASKSWVEGAGEIGQGERINEEKLDYLRNFDCDVWPTRRTAGCAAYRERLQADLRRQNAERLGLRSRFLARAGWRNRQPDHDGASAEAEYFLHLEGRPARQFRAEARLQNDRRE